MSVATDYCTPPKIDSNAKSCDTSAECFYYFPVKSVETACGKLLKQDSIKTRCRALADRATATMTRIKTKITHHWKSESIRRNLKIAAYIAAAIAVFILINAVTVGLLAPLVLLGGIGVILLIEFGVILFPLSIALSIYAAYKVAENINSLPRLISPTFREENNNPHRENVPVILLDGIKELHQKLLIVAEKDVQNLSQEDISTLFHMLKEVDDLSKLASGNKDYEKAKKSLTQYLQKNAKARLKDNKMLLEKIKDHALMKDTKRLEHLIETINRHTSNEEIPLNYLDEITDIVMAYMDEESIHPSIEALATKLRPRLLDQLDKENKALLHEFTELTELKVLTGDDNMIAFINADGDEDEINLYDLVDKLHTIEKLHQLLPVLTAYSRSCITAVENDPATDDTVYISASPVSEIPFSVTASKPDSPTRKAEKRLPEFETKEDLFKINRIYILLREKLLKLAGRDNQAAGCNGPQRMWAMRSATRRIKHFWEDRKHPVKLDTVETNEDTYESPIDCIPFDEVAPTLKTADNIVLLLKDGRIYARDELRKWAEQQNCDDGLLISPYTRETAHVLDMCPLPAMIPEKAFTLETFLPQALPLHFIMQLPYD